MIPSAQANLQQNAQVKVQTSACLPVVGPHAFISSHITPVLAFLHYRFHLKNEKKTKIKF